MVYVDTCHEWNAAVLLCIVFQYMFDNYEYMFDYAFILFSYMMSRWVIYTST